MHGTPSAERPSGTKDRVPAAARKVGGAMVPLAEMDEGSGLGWERVPVVPALAHRGTISLSVLANIITPRAPCNSRPDSSPGSRPGS